MLRSIQIDGVEVTSFSVVFKESTVLTAWCIFGDEDAPGLNVCSPMKAIVTYDAVDERRIIRNLLFAARGL